MGLKRDQNGTDRTDRTMNDRKLTVSASVQKESAVLNLTNRITY